MNRRYSYDRRTAFKVDTGIVDEARRAYELAKKVERDAHEVHAIMQGTLSQLTLAVSKAKRGKGDLRNLLPVYEEVKSCADDIEANYRAIRGMGLSTTVGSALSELDLEMPDTPSLHVV